MGHSGGVTSIKPCVVLDTNMLMMVYRGIDVFHAIEELLAMHVEFIVPRPVYDELLHLASSRRPVERRAALYVLQLLDRGRALVRDIPRPTGKVDEDIALFAANNKCFVATNDRELRRRLRKLGVPDIHLRESEGVLEASYIPPIL